MMKSVVIFLILFLASENFIMSQEKGNGQFGNVALADFELVKSPVVDENTNGIFLFDIGSTKFILDKRKWFSFVFTRHIRVKIINNKAFDLGTLKFSLFGLNEEKDELSDLKAQVFNLENGNIISTKVEKNDILYEKRSPFVNVAKLAMPAIKEGSIIDFTYTITSFRYYYIPTWYFQHIEYPCLYSQYQITIPDLLSYGMIRYGFNKLTDERKEEIKNNKYYMDLITVISNDQKRTWIMKDVPGFSEGKFINSSKNYLDKLQFNLVRIYNGEQIHSMGTSWETVTNELLSTPYFGVAIDRVSSANLLNTAEKITSDDKSPLEIIQHLYSYVQDNFICIPNDDILFDNDLYDINKKKRGNVAELNMLLIDLLRQKNILADPVILSTQDYGINLGDYPMFEKMNYVICMVRLAGDTLYLDASRPGNGFGHLPLDCYNGYARIISEQGGAVYFDPESIKEIETTTVFIVNESKEKSDGGVEMDPGFFGTEKIKMEIKESGTKKYFENIRSEMTNETALLNPGIDSIDKSDFPVKVHFDFDLPLQGDILYFNPVLLTEFKQNPFKAEKRIYPVSFAKPVNELYTLNMAIPEGYVVDEIPKSAKVSFNENEGFFEYLIQANQQSIQLRSRIILPKVFYPPEDYQSLRGFYTFIVAKYSEQIVFKKKK
jgi:hypothetical protein